MYILVDQKQRYLTPAHNWTRDEGIASIFESKEEAKETADTVLNRQHRAMTLYGPIDAVEESVQQELDDAIFDGDLNPIEYFKGQKVKLVPLEDIQHDEDWEPDYGYEDDYDCEFADPGGNSALRAATHDTCPQCFACIDEDDSYCRDCGGTLNPRNLPCGNCKRPNMLTPEDKARGYQCDGCADAVERGGYGYGEY